MFPDARNGALRLLVLCLSLAILTLPSALAAPSGPGPAQPTTMVAPGLFQGPLEPVGPASDPIPLDAEGQAKLDALVDRMTARWLALDAACDPAAVFSLLYLETTKAVASRVEAGYFQDNAFLAEWTVAFSDPYEQAVDAWRAGEVDEVSGPWRAAFELAAAGQTTVMEDAWLGMNVHINADLGRVTHAMGLVEDERHEDFLRVNDVLGSIGAQVWGAVAYHYDPLLFQGAHGQAGKDTVNIFHWRDAAWQDATILERFEGTDRYDGHVATMDQQTTQFHEHFVKQKPASTLPARTGYCQWQNAGFP